MDSTEVTRSRDSTEVPRERKNAKFNKFFSICPTSMDSIQRVVSLESTGSLLPQLQTVHPSHIHRKANKLADRLANEGVHLVQGDLDLDWDSTPNNELKQNCLQISIEDLNHPDGVPGMKKKSPVPPSTCNNHTLQAADDDTGVVPCEEADNPSALYGTPARLSGRNEGNRRTVAHQDIPVLSNEEERTHRNDRPSSDDDIWEVAGRHVTYHPYSMLRHEDAKS